MSRDLLIFLVLLLLVILVSIYKKKLTIPGTLMACLVGILVFLGFGLKGIIITGTFFLLGNLATSWGWQTKERLNDSPTGQRTAGQVFANGGMPAILALAALLFPGKESMLFLVFCAAFSSATADTVSSELGTVYGKKFFNIISFASDQRGENGVISLEGTLSGMAGSVAIASLHALYMGFDISFAIIVIAGTIGNFFDSILGATLEREGSIDNNTVNFLNTVTAAVVAYMLS